MGDGKSDPRPDQHPDDGVPGKYPDPPDNSKTQPAPGGVGTDTPNDPSNAPGAGPKKDK